MKQVHWTQRVKKPRVSMYRQTLGKPELRALGAQALYGDLEAAKAKGQVSYAKYITSELRSIGEGDYTPADEGEPPKGAQW